MTDDRRRERSGDPRVPPHNLDAEAAVLGAALLAPAAAELLSTATTPADFYRPAHVHIAQAIAYLAAGETPVDTVTVTDALRRSGILDEIGGSAYLHELQNATPAISAASHYAKIVRDTATLRRLIGAATRIADLAYAQPDDPTAAISQAGQLVDGLAGEALADLSAWEVADIAALLETDLEPEEATLLRRTDGGGLFYAGKVHGIQGEPTAGKSWIGLALCIDALELGGSAMYIDYEDTSTGIVRRTLQLGADPVVVRERFDYRQLYGPLGSAEKLNLMRAVDRLNPDVVVVDGVAEALSREGRSEDKATDIVAWAESLLRPLARAGSAVVMLDHVSKDPEQRGRWARGSGAKLAIVDGVTYQAKVIRPFSRERDGDVDLVIAKDRPGGVGAVGHTAARVHFEPHGKGERLLLRFDPHEPEHTAGDQWKPTIIMGRLFDELSHAKTPLTASGLLQLVKTDKAATKREALQRLIAEGYLEASGRPKILRIVKPYHAAGRTATHNSSAPAWREPPPELDLDDHDGPSVDEIAYLDQTRPFYDHPNY